MSEQHGGMTNSNMGKLAVVIVEITRVLNYLPKVSGNLAWRLHTDDWMDVRKELFQWCESHPDAVKLPLSQLMILGVPVYGDDNAPRLANERAR